MMVDFAFLCMGLEQNNGIVTVVDFNTEKNIQLKACFTIGKYSTILCVKFYVCLSKFWHIL